MSSDGLFYSSCGCRWFVSTGFLWACCESHEPYVTDDTFTAAEILSAIEQEAHAEYGIAL